MPDQARGNECLADVGAGRGDEDRGHVLPKNAGAHDVGQAGDLGVGMLPR